MSNRTSTTRWKGKAHVPESYELEPLVKLARKARGQSVEFDWTFNRKDLERLRAVVHDSAIENRGRYRGFDASVLRVINEALGESNSRLSVADSMKTGKKTFAIRCAQDGEEYRLHGDAPFDVVLGYGLASHTERWKAQLGQAATETLASAVGLLGWDLLRLQEESLRPVRNTLFGFGVAYKMSRATPASGPAIEALVHFSGPFSALEGQDYRCLFTDDVGSQKGVYLWTLAVNGVEHAWYVGQTRRGFAQRMGEHVSGYLSGTYGVPDVQALLRGKHLLVNREIGDERWPQCIPSILRNWRTVMPQVEELIQRLRFHVAPATGSEHLYDRIEGAIGRHYKFHADDALRGFFTPGLKLPAEIPGDRPLRLTLSSDMSIAGFPATL